MQIARHLIWADELDWKLFRDFYFIHFILSLWTEWKKYVQFVSLVFPVLPRFIILDQICNHGLRNGHYG